jgi:hypothetical protein
MAAAKTPRVEMYKLANRLKAKLGFGPKDDKAGYLAPEAIAEAEALIKSLCENSQETISKCLVDLEETWNKMQTMEAGTDRAAVSHQVFTLAHEIKDIGSMCGYKLVAYFAESLRDYIEQTQLNLKAQKIIIQAHIDAMKTAHHKNLREDGGPAADELKAIVKIAIDKYK